MRCPDHCPAPAGIPWPWILLALAIAAFAVFMTWFAVTVGKLGLFLIGAVPAVIVIVGLGFVIDCAIQNTRRVRKTQNVGEVEQAARPVEVGPVTVPSPAPVDELAERRARRDAA